MTFQVSPEKNIRGATPLSSTGNRFWTELVVTGSGYEYDPDQKSSKDPIQTIVFRPVFIRDTGTGTVQKKN
jgi:hypothetical protein